MNTGIYDEIFFRKDDVNSSQWPKLICSAAEELEINSTVKASTFQGDGSSLDGIVKKAGDTMTGALTIDDNLTVNGAIATNQLNVTGSITAPLTIDDNLTVKGAIIANQLKFNGNAHRRVYGDSRAGSDTLVLDGRWNELEVKGRVIDWTGSNLHIGYQNDHSDHNLFIGNGKLKSVTIQGSTNLIVGGNLNVEGNISGTGNVGIGTTSPASGAKLDVRGNLYVGGGAAIASNNYWHRAQSTDDNHYGWFEVRRKTNNQRGFYLGYGSPGKYVDLRLEDGNDLAITGGKVGIGTKNPKSTMHIVGDLVLGKDVNNQKFIFHSRTNGNGDFLHITCDNSAGGWNWSKGILFFRNGDVTIRGTLQQGSSRELKENINNMATEEAMETLEGLNPIKFNYKEDDQKETHLGFIAEDVPELVASQDRKGLSPMDIVAVLTKVVKEQQNMISGLTKKVKTLEQKNR